MPLRHERYMTNNASCVWRFSSLNQHNIRKTVTSLSFNYGMLIYVHALCHKFFNDKHIFNICDISHDFSGNMIVVTYYHSKHSWAKSICPDLKTQRKKEKEHWLYPPLHKYKVQLFMSSFLQSTPDVLHF